MSLLNVNVSNLAKYTSGTRAYLESLLSDVSNQFDPESSYSEGDYVVYKNRLRKFTAAHSGAWSDLDNVTVDLEGIVDELSTAIGNKGVTVPTGTKLEEMSGYVGQIVPGGNGGWDGGHAYEVENILGKDYNTILVNDTIWTAESLTYKGPELSINPSGTPSSPCCWDYNGTVLYNGYAAESINGLLPDGWRVTNSTDWTKLISYCLGTESSNLVAYVAGSRAYGGINAFGLSFEKRGYRGVSGSFGTGEGDYRLATSWQGVFMRSNDNDGKGVSSPQSWNSVSGGQIRLCKDA